MTSTRDFIIAAELTFQNAINATGTLLGAQLAQIIGFAPGAVATAAARTAMLTGGETASVNCAFRGEAALAFQIKLFAFTPAEFTNRTKILRHILLSSTSNYTRRFLGGRQPLCGT